MFNTKKIFLIASIMSIPIYSFAIDEETSPSFGIPETAISYSAEETESTEVNSAYNSNVDKTFNTFKLSDIDERLSNIDGKATYTGTTKKTENLSTVVQAAKLLAEKATDKAILATSSADRASSIAAEAKSKSISTAKDITSMKSALRTTMATQTYAIYIRLRNSGNMASLSGPEIKVLEGHGLLRQSASYNTGHIRHDSLPFNDSQFIAWACSASNLRARGFVGNNLNSGYVYQRDPGGRHKSHSAICKVRVFTNNATYQSIYNSIR